ncbi:MAG: hypothetical protein L0H53_06125 [Candidatus Nitrosocosmicus sp.]|nr:hypothetical protein [Candidatus Nitrosocosmicus sp.]MDN5866111.1 hypothetical protein [Candidatus Nitrosocosmicus sp.]
MITISNYCRVIILSNHPESICIMAINFLNNKEKLVMELLEEGKNFQEIAKEEHVSFTFISMVKKKILGQDPSVTKKLSTSSQCLKLFSEGKSLLEVTIILDRPLAEIQGYHNDYLRLKGVGYLVSLVEAHRDHLPTISKLIKYVIQNRFTKNDLTAALTLVNDITRLKNTKKNLEVRIEYLNQTRNQLLNNRRIDNLY